VIIDAEAVMIGEEWGRVRVLRVFRPFRLVLGLVFWFENFKNERVFLLLFGSIGFWMFGYSAL
jgi:hypothetical protein